MNELKIAADNAKKEYLENVCNDIMEFQTAGRYNLTYMETKELGWKENRAIQNIDSEVSEGNITVESRHVLKIWENCYRALRST
jgi:hypothetical protein